MPAPPVLAERLWQKMGRRKFSIKSIPNIWAIPRVISIPRRNHNRVEYNKGLRPKRWYNRHILWEHQRRAFTPTAARSAMISFFKYPHRASWMPYFKWLASNGWGVISWLPNWSKRLIGPLYHLWKKGYKQGKLCNIFLGRVFSTVTVNDVTHTLENVERKPQGQ